MMRTSGYIAAVSGGVVLGGLFLLPLAQASGQTLQRQEGLALSAAIEEAKRSPFHAHVGVNQSADAQVAPGIDPVALLLSGSVRPPLQETGGDSQEVTDRARNRALFWDMLLGMAAGDVLGMALFKETEHPWVGIGLLSIPTTTWALRSAGVSPGRAFVASALGYATGLGAGALTFAALHGPLYVLVVFPVALVYYGVRLSVTRLTAG